MNNDFYLIAVITMGIAVVGFVGYEIGKTVERPREQVAKVIEAVPESKEVSTLVAIPMESNQAQGQNSMVNRSAVLLPKGKHIRGYLWRAKRGERLSNIFETLWNTGWRFGKKNHQNSFDTFIFRVINNSLLDTIKLTDTCDEVVRDGIVLKDTVLNFSPKGKRTYPVRKRKMFKGNKKTMLARVTVYSPKEKGEGSRNHRGKDVRNEVGMAVPSRTLKDGTRVYIPGVGTRIVDDRIPRWSVNKHKRVARRRGKPIDIVLDVRYYGSVTGNRKQLRKRDKGYVKVYIED